MKKSVLAAAVVLLAFAASTSAQAFEQEYSQSITKHGQKFTQKLGVNIKSFPVKNVTDLMWSRFHSHVSARMLYQWAAWAQINPSQVDAGAATCEGLLGGRMYILDRGNVSNQVITPVSTDGPVDALTPKNIQYYAAGSQINLTPLFCRVWGYERAVALAQLQGDMAGYIPLCMLTQGNTCGIVPAFDKHPHGAGMLTVNGRVVDTNQCVPGTPGCN